MGLVIVVAWFGILVFAGIMRLTAKWWSKG
jgi:hypothetical protein